VNKSLEEFRFYDSASLLYQFVWHELCDWYLEMTKPILYGNDEELRNSSLSTAVHVLETALGLLHPFIPFVTEELWQGLPCVKKTESLSVSKYPTEANGVIDKEVEEKMKLVIDAVTGIRSIRGELNLPPSLELKAIIKTSDGTGNILKENIAYISKLAKTSSIDIGYDVSKPEDAAFAIMPAMEIFIPLKGLLNVDTEIKRLSKEITKVEESLSVVKKKLTNREFVNRAPKAVVEENRARHQEFAEKIQAIQNNIEKLKQWGKQNG